MNHDIPVNDIRDMFDTSHSFFELPEDIKETYYMDHPRNAGWEKITQVKHILVRRKDNKQGVYRFDLVLV